MAIAIERMAPRESVQRQKQSLLLSKRASRMQRLGSFAGHFFLFLVTSASAFAVLFIFYFIIKDALPFFTEGAKLINWQRTKEFFTSTAYYPTVSPPAYGSLALFVGSGLVTLGAIVVAVPLGVAAAVCLSDVLPFGARQLVKPVIEILAAIPSVAYGFFALVVFAPLLQERGGHLLAVATWVIGIPVGALLIMVLGDLAAVKLPDQYRAIGQFAVTIALGAIAAIGLWYLSDRMSLIQIPSGTNALNVAIILGIMAMPTVISVSEDALQAAGRDLREGSYALGATRAETLTKVIIPAAGSGIAAAVILGIMRAIGETMVVWMASGNAAQIPQPWYNVLNPVRTLTATIAGDMGEADQLTGSLRYHILFALALVLLTISFVCNLVSEWIVRRARRGRG